MTALRHIFVVAHNTYREAVREKLLYNLLIFAGLMIASSIVLAKIHIGYDERIYYDVGLGAIALFGALIAIFVGINLVYREISQKTVYTMLAKPVHRWEFLLGKYAGLLALLALEVGVMSACFLAVLRWQGVELGGDLGWAIGLIFVELALVTAVAIFFSTFTTPYLAGMFTVAIWIAGHLLADVRAFGQHSEVAGIQTLTEVIYWALPNFDRLDLKAAVGTGQPIELARVAAAAGYATLNIIALLLASVLLFRRRDFS